MWNLCKPQLLRCCHQIKALNLVLQKRLLLPSQERTHVLTEILARCRSGNTKSGSYPDGTFKADEMEITMLPDEQLQKKPSHENIKLWRHFTDYMFSVRWNDEHGWATPKIDPVGSFKIHPASKCLNYGVEVIEGMKAYRGHDGCVRLFRPDLSLKRFLVGAKRMLLPSFDPNELIECIKRLVKLESDWIPEEEGSSLYIRPVFIGTDPSLDVTACKSALLYVILCPIAESELNFISLYANPDYVKAWPGGNGDIKAGGNYCTPIYVQRMAEEHDCQQVLWLQRPDLQITDIGNMNVFFVIRKDNGEREVVTPPLNGLILNGIVRQSVIQLFNEWKEFNVNEQIVTMPDLKKLLQNNQLREMFGSGTPNIITPVDSVFFEGSKFDIPTARQDQPIYKRIRKALTDIYYGKVDHDWAIRIDQ